MRKDPAKRKSAIKTDKSRVRKCRLSAPDLQREFELLGGSPDSGAGDTDVLHEAIRRSARLRDSEDDRAHLRKQVASLKETVADLRSDLEDLESGRRPPEWAETPLDPMQLSVAAGALWQGGLTALSRGDLAEAFRLFHESAMAEEVERSKPLSAQGRAASAHSAQLSRSISHALLERVRQSPRPFSIDKRPRPRDSGVREL